MADRAPKEPVGKMATELVHRLQGRAAMGYDIGYWNRDGQLAGRLSQQRVGPNWYGIWKGGGLTGWCP